MKFTGIYFWDRKLDRTWHYRSEATCSTYVLPFPHYLVCNLFEDKQTNIKSYIVHLLEKNKQTVRHLCSIGFATELSSDQAILRDRYKVTSLKIIPTSNLFVAHIHVKFTEAVCVFIGKCSRSLWFLEFRAR